MGEVLDEVRCGIECNDLNCACVRVAGFAIFSRICESTFSYRRRQRCLEANERVAGKHAERHQTDATRAVTPLAPDLSYLTTIGKCPGPCSEIHRGPDGWAVQVHEELELRRNCAQQKQKNHLPVGPNKVGVYGLLPAFADALKRESSVLHSTRRPLEHSI